VIGGEVDSYYARTRTETHDFPRLDHDLDVVVGGGLAGCATALNLAERGVEVALIESRSIGWGASGRNGGFASQAFPIGWQALAGRVGLDSARQIQRIARLGLDLVRQRIDAYAIDCGPLQPGRSAATSRGAATGLAAAKGRKAVATSRGRITADRVVLTCGGYIDRLEARVSGGTVPIASFVMATEPLGTRLQEAIRVPYAIYDNQVATNHYRPLPDTRLLWGRRVLAWQPPPARIAALLKRDMVSVYPALRDARVEVAWGGMMPFTRHKLPVIGQVEPDVWYATGFGGLGVTLTSAAEHLIARGIVEGDDTWRLFEDFGLPYAGGKLGKVPAQMVYWGHQFRAGWARHRTGRLQTRSALRARP